MIHKRFDDLARSLSNRPSRRHLLAGLAGSVLASSTARFPQVINAKRKRKRKKRKNRKQKPRFNDFGCVNVGDFCKTSEQCCSGICSGKKGKKRCQEHDASTCQAGELPTVCGGRSEFCISSDGFEGACATSTGSGGYCFASGDCFACTNDVDCEAACGPGAGCIPCAETCGPARGGTFCAGLAADSCNFDA
jgi:hypothetical protein